jgi:hypothetical protein
MLLDYPKVMSRLLKHLVHVSNETRHSLQYLDMIGIKHMHLTMIDECMVTRTDKLEPNMMNERSIDQTCFHYMNTIR